MLFMGGTSKVISIANEWGIDRHVWIYLQINTDCAARSMSIAFSLSIMQVKLKFGTMSNYL